MARLNVVDLNQLRPAKTSKGKTAYDWDDQDRGVKSGKVRAHLGDIATPLEEFLRGSEAIVGCVAWITSQRLVDALDGIPVSLIVNKEFDLRPNDAKPAAVRHRQLLGRLTGGLRRADFPAPLNQVAGAGDDSIDPVRCMGHIGRGRASNTPLMHHKFVVRLTDGKPVAVWSGSFNFTAGAQLNAENAVEIHDPVIARAYLAEWARVAALSEPLEFAAGKADPTWKAARPKPAASKKAPAKAAKRRAHGRAQVAPVTEPKTRRAKATTSRNSNRRAAA